MPRAHPFRIHEPGPRQFVNELLGNRAFERGDALALHRPLELHLQLSSGCNLDCYMCHEHLRPEGTRHGKGSLTPINQQKGNLLRLQAQLNF